MAYKVDLEIYNGPMDLLLYLIRREEVDIRDIEIARIADQYIAYLEELQKLDIELAGDFVVMAATLLELKSRALLPRPPEVEEGEEAEETEDPRETLIRQLIEYRRFKDAAVLLAERGREMARRFPRQIDAKLLAQYSDEENVPPGEILQGVEIWDLISAFSQVIRTLGYSKPREVTYDDTPVEDAARDLLARIAKERSILFSQLFEKGRGVTFLITTFLAVLELIRQRRIGAEQEADFKDLRLFVRDPATEQVVQIDPKGAGESRDALERKKPRRPTFHQKESLREMMEDVEFEKTEFDEILDSIKVPEVEAYKPLYSEKELLGEKDAEAAGTATPDAPAAEAPAVEGAAAPAAPQADEPPAAEGPAKDGAAEPPPPA